MLDALTAFLPYVSCTYVHALVMGCLQATATYANKICSFSSISWRFLVDFVCKGVRKAFQDGFKSG